MNYAYLVSFNVYCSIIWFLLISKIFRSFCHLMNALSVRGFGGMEYPGCRSWICLHWAIMIVPFRETCEESWPLVFGKKSIRYRSFKCWGINKRRFKFDCIFYDYSLFKTNNFKNNFAVFFAFWWILCFVGGTSSPVRTGMRMDSRVLIKTSISKHMT